MSAFVVDPKTINTIIGHIKWSKDNDYAKTLLNKADWSVDNDDLAGDLGRAMYLLNISAVAQRYPNDATYKTLPGTIGDDDLLAAFEYQPNYQSSQIQAFKSLQCWLYQCDEGKAPNSPLFKAMEKIKNHIASQIVYTLPEYDQAKWS